MKHQFTSKSVLNLRRRPHEVRAVAGGGGTIGGAGQGNGGGGGDGDSSWGRGDDDESSKKEDSFLVKGWKERVAADPQFGYKVLIEQVIGVGASVIGDMSSRPNWGLNELDFVFATLIVGSIVNFALMYLLAPTAPAAGAAAATGMVAKIFSDHNLVAWGAPGGHMFQPGFSVAKRAVNFAYKGTIFAFIGLSAGLIGTAISNGLLLARKRFDPSFETQNTPPNVLANASCWALHMGVSSNLRYQILNGMDMILQPKMPSAVFRLFTPVIRGANNAVGGVSFVVLAKLLGVQKAAEPVPEPEGKKSRKGKKSK